MDDKYTNIITSNVMDTKETQKTIELTLDYIASVLKHTLGPHSGTTLVQDRNLQHFMSKDGYTVLDNIFIRESLPRTVLDLIKRISKKLVGTVGDGSTSSVIVANSLYKNLLRICNEYNVPQRDMLTILNRLGDIFTETIYSNAVKITPENFEKIKDIASISLNNDYDTAETIYSMFKEVGNYGFVNIVLGSSEDMYTLTSGFDTYRGYLNELSVTEADKKTAKFENAFVMMCNDTLIDSDIEHLSELLGFALQYKRPLVIIAKDYSYGVKTFFHTNMAKLRVQAPDFYFAYTDMSTATLESRGKFEDLAMYLGCTVFDKINDPTGEAFFGVNGNDFVSKLGVCNNVTMNENSSKFIGGEGDQKVIDDRINYLKSEIENINKIDGHIDHSEVLISLKKRIAGLQKSMAIYYVGGATEDEKRMRRFLIEDAIYACQSALEYGYTLGGNINVPIIIADFLNDFKEYLSGFIADHNESLFETDVDRDSFAYTLLETISDSFEDSFKAVLMNNPRCSEDDADLIIRNCIRDKNLYNVLTSTYEGIEVSKVINSADTDAQIIKAAFSIIGMLVTSNQFIDLNLPFTKE